MLPKFNTRLSCLPSLTFVRELECFEGPILTEWKAEDGHGGMYLEKWCTCSKGVERSIVVRTEPRAVAEYLGERISMRSLMLGPSDGVGFVVDRRGGKVIDVFLVSLVDGSDLIETYLPRNSSFHDTTLRPSWDVMPQSFLIGSTWNAQLLSTTERRYQDVTGFCFLTEPKTHRTLPPRILKYRYDRGYPIATAFERIRYGVPLEKRPRSVDVAASSPGVLTLEAPSSTANHLASVLAVLPKCKAAFERVLRWSKISPSSLERMPHVGTARKQLVKLCSALLVNVSAVLPTEMQDDERSVLVAGKLVAAYYRKLWDLVETKDAEFISAPVGHDTREPTCQDDDD